MCVEGEDAVATQQWNFVGAGRGSYEVGQKYSFVGEGGGSFEPASPKKPMCGIGAGKLSVFTIVVLAALGAISGAIFFVGTGALGTALRHLEYDPDRAGIQPEGPEFESYREGCATLCEFRDVSAPCGARMQWAADHRFTGKADACQLAEKVVKEQCPTCSTCDFASTGCAAVAV